MGNKQINRVFNADAHTSKHTHTHRDAQMHVIATVSIAFSMGKAFTVIVV